jgi:hypothetical protein
MCLLLLLLLFVLYSVPKLQNELLLKKSLTSSVEDGEPVYAAGMSVAQNTPSNGTMIAELRIGKNLTESGCGPIKALSRRCEGNRDPRCYG